VPLIPFLAALLLVFLLILSAPLLLVVRYRMGAARRPARRWVTNINVISLLASAGLLLWAAAITSFWVPNTFRYSLIGFAAGALLGLFGLWLTRWEAAARALYYTPNRWVVLLLTLALSVRLVYGLWRIWHAWRTTGADASWLASAGVAGSMAVGAVVVGYYLVYFAGVRWKLRTR
jgi:membrane protein CcdC involved in cytochrome C biogenesis